MNITILFLKELKNVCIHRVCWLSGNIGYVISSAEAVSDIFFITRASTSMNELFCKLLLSAYEGTSITLLYKTDMKGQSGHSDAVIYTVE